MLKSYYYRATAFIKEERKLCHFFYKTDKPLSEEELVKYFDTAIKTVYPKYDHLELQRIPKELYYERTKKI